MGALRPGRSQRRTRCRRSADPAALATDAAGGTAGGCAVWGFFAEIASFCFFNGGCAVVLWWFYGDFMVVLG